MLLSSIHLSKNTGVVVMALCSCSKEYSVLDDKCTGCGKQKRLGSKAVDVVNEVGDLLGF